MSKEDYFVLEEYEDHIIVGFGFSHFNRDCDEYIIHNNCQYKWGPLEAMRLDEASHLCAKRRYNLYKKLA